MQLCKPFMFYTLTLARSRCHAHVGTHNTNVIATMLGAKDPFEASPKAGKGLQAALPSASSPARVRAAAAGGGGGAALPLRQPPQPVEKIFDPDWTEAELKDGTVFWFRVDHPENPTFTRPLVQPLVAARNLYSSFARQALVDASRPIIQNADKPKTLWQLFPRRHANTFKRDQCPCSARQYRAMQPRVLLRANAAAA